MYVDYRHFNYLIAVNKPSTFIGTVLPKDLQAEIEAHQSIFTALNEAGSKAPSNEEQENDAETLQVQLETMNERWSKLQGQSAEIRKRLEANAEEWAALVASIEELLTWIERERFRT
ncbi:dystrophin-like protein [Apostichopus japonicus]|uniref:Dystrophin-like protein n=1 Tax=Stichopus japonicus TaxID=307972 RepID=A0A2G8KIC1_STIJA|nr:dystrophin-like protein [Apostichopus japonicus]